MGAATVDRDTKFSQPGKAAVQVAATTDIPCGVMVADNGAGKAINMSDGASYYIIGVSTSHADNNPTVVPAPYVDLAYDRSFWFVNVNLTIADRGAVVYADDNQSVRSASGGFDNAVGILEDVDATLGCLVYVPSCKALVTGTVALDMAVGRDAAITRNLTVGGTSNVTGVATFDAKSVHSLGITITAGGQTITLGDLTLTAGDLLMTKGKAVLTEGGLTLTKGALLLSEGGATLTLGDLTLTAGDLLMTKGKAVLTEGGLTLTKGSMLLTAGDLTMTKGTLKMIGVTATEGVQVGYNHANTAAPPVIGEATTAFGAPAAGRNGFVGVLHDDGGVAYLIAVSNGVFYQVALAACGA